MHLYERRRFILGIGLYLVAALIGVLVMFKIPATLDTWVWAETIETRNTHRTPIVDAVTQVFDPASSVFIALAFAILMWVITKRYEAALFVATGIAGSAALTRVLKEVFGRERPPVHLRMVEELSPSLPSGHATAVAAIMVSAAVIIWYMTPRKSLRVGAWVVAAFVMVAVCYTRFYLGVHWFTDICAGLCVGTGSVLLASPLLTRALRKSTRRSAHIQED